MVWPRFNVFLFSKDQSTGHNGRGKEEEADTRRSGKKISKSRQQWSLPAQLGQLKTEYDKKGLLRTHVRGPNDLPRLWDRIEQKRGTYVSQFFLEVNKQESSYLAYVGRIRSNCIVKLNRNKHHTHTTPFPHPTELIYHECSKGLLLLCCIIIAIVRPLSDCL